MKTTRIYQCENSVEGIFTAVYVAWASSYGHDYIKIEVQDGVTTRNLELFSEYIPVETNSELANKVSNSIVKKISDRAHQMVVRAALSDGTTKANSIYHFLVRGFALGSKVVDYLSDSYVADIFELNRRVGNETHFYTEFARFVELENGILLAKVEPRCNVIELITSHFADRLRNENFMILDVKRKITTVHPSNATWYLTHLSTEETDSLVHMAESEKVYEVLWKAFFNSIAIKERESYERQRGHVALHYRKYMTEFLK